KHLQGDLTVFNSLQMVGKGVAADILVEQGRIVGIQDAVASLDAHLFTGTALQGLDDGNGIVDIVEAHPDPHEVAFHAFAEQCVLFLGNVDGVGVEILQDPVHGDIDDAVGVNVVNVFVFYVIDEAGEFLFLLVWGEQAARVIGKIELCAKDHPEGAGEAQKQWQIFSRRSLHSSSSVICFNSIPAFSKNSNPEVSL